MIKLNGIHCYHFCSLFWSQKVAEMAIFHTEYLKSLQLAKQVHKTKKLVFGLNFIIPGAPDSENWRFGSYTACKIDFFELFTTDFTLTTQ